MPNIIPGDRVRYTAEFLRSIACYTGPMPFARGIVVELQRLSDECILAEIEWETDEDLPEKVNVFNLERIW